MRLKTETYKAYAIPLSVALCLHGIILLILLPEPATIIDNALLSDSPKKIESYLYKPPAKQTEEEKNKIEVSAQDPKLVKEVEVQELSEIREPSVPEQEQQTQSTIQPQKISQTPTPSMQSSDKPKATFNPFKGLREQNARKDRELSVPVNSGQYGYSVFQELPEPVPERIIRKSAEQVRRENTTVVGNETIEKRDGYCYQETDLSFINDEFGKTASVSACGESSKDKYFREFMEGVAKRR